MCHVEIAAYSFFSQLHSRLVMILPGTDKDGCKVCIHRPGKEGFILHTTIVNIISNCNGISCHSTSNILKKG